MAIMLLTSAAASVLACSALVLCELVSSRDETLEQVATLARIVSANSTAALAFRDDQDAQEVLATRTEPSIVAAALAVGDFEGFARRGGIIRFATVGNKIRLRVNLAAAEQAKLTISSKLLRPAQIVETGQD